MNEYIENVIKTVEKRDNAKPEYIQCVKEVFRSLEKVIEQHPEYVEDDLLTRMAEPDRLITFRVAWVDDAGKTQINRGYRVQFNSSIGPYKGGLRFHPSVNSSIMYFLGFEQTFKNSLTGLPMGGAKGGSDFDPRGKSKGEIMRFCQAFMTELYRHIGPNVDVPAGDIGVGAREIGFLFGQYKRISDAFENGVITGKGLSYGGSLIRPEATGYGAVYYLCEVLKHEEDKLKGKTVAVSGFGNVAWGACKKLAELGAIPVTISGPDGYIYDKDGIITEEKINYLLEMRASGRDRCEDYADKFGVPFYKGEKPWGIKVDIAMPCATQNEIGIKEAKQIIANGTKYYIEVANMPTTEEALNFLIDRKEVIVAPSKAVNAGGVCVSGLEMSQNSQRLSWTAEEVDEKLHNAMINIHKHSVEAAEKYGLGCDGRARSREYYRRFAEALPKDTVILTAGCAKYKYNKLDLGTIDGIPRVLDAGQCNDSYSLALIALKLKEAFGLDDVNQLPIVYNIAWYEQKAVAVLLTLLSLGIRKMKLGPSLPAFVSPGLLRLLVEKFDIAPVSTPEEDLAAALK